MNQKTFLKAFLMLILASMTLALSAHAEWAPSIVRMNDEGALTLETLFDIARVRSATSPPLLRVDVYGGAFDVDFSETWQTAFHLRIPDGGASHVLGSQIVAGGLDVCPNPPPGAVLLTEPIPEELQHPDGSFRLALRFGWVETCRPGPGLGFRYQPAEDISFSVFDIERQVAGEARSSPLRSFEIPRVRDAGEAISTRLLWIQTSERRIFGVASAEDGDTFRPGFNLAGGWRPDGILSWVSPEDLGVVSEERPRFFGHLELECSGCALWSFQVFDEAPAILMESLGYDE